MDAKVLAKVLAVRLAGVISDLVHEDQTGFRALMKERGYRAIVARTLTKRVAFQ